MHDRALIRTGAAGAIVVAICCAAPLLAVPPPLAGLGAWLTGSGLVVLSLIAAGLGLVAAGMLGGPRWLIVPVIVLVLPLAVVSAADIDLRGGVGEREIRPRTLADLEPQYKFGVGHMDVDLRRLELPATTTQVNLKLGMGEARVRVPAGTCVVTDAKIGVGAGA